MDRGDRASIYVIVGLIAAVIAILWVGPDLKSKATFGAVVRDGRVLNEALDKYKADRGAYPDKLEMLVPGYLSEISEPMVRVRRQWPRWETRSTWLYERSADGMAYRLWAESKPSFGYDSQTDEWGILDGKSGVRLGR